MDIELPVLRLGLAGFSEPRQKIATDLARAAGGPDLEWQVGPFAEADAWWVEGGRTHVAARGLMRVQPGVPSARAVQLALADVDRPIAFTLPLPAGFQPAVAFALEERAQALAVLNQFGAWMHAMVTQFWLASSIASHQPTLGSGSWEVLRGGDLLAVVDLRLGAGVAPGVTRDDFARATWCIRDHGAVRIPPDFTRASVSQVMWQYALRTTGELLPPHYRMQPLYFRRPPKLKPNQLRDAHLLLLRELNGQPGMTFEMLQQSTGLGDVALARHLSALYVVGSITANPRRAAGVGRRPGDDSRPDGASLFASEIEASSFEGRRADADATAPAPLLSERTLPAALLPEHGR